MNDTVYVVPGGLLEVPVIGKVREFALQISVLPGFPSDTAGFDPTKTTNVLGGSTNYIPLWNGSTMLSSSGMYQNSGDIGINQTSFQWAATNRRVLEINGTSQSLIGLNVNGAKAGYIWQNGNDMTISAENAGYIQFGTNGVSSRMRIGSDGNIGIGTTSPGSKLDVNGKILAGSATETLNGLSAINSSSLQATVYSYNYNPSGWSIYSAQGINYFSGNVGIGITSPSYKLDVTGTFRAYYDASTYLTLDSSNISIIANGTVTIGNNSTDAITIGHASAETRPTTIKGSPLYLQKRSAVVLSPVLAIMMMYR